MSKMDFNQIKQLIVAKKTIDLSKINFNINEIDEDEQEVTNHKGAHSESKTVTITRRTLVHYAIEAENEDALTQLLKSGANSSIPCVKSRKDMHLEDSDWSSFSQWEEMGTPKEITQSSVELATGLKSILAILEKYKPKKTPVSSISSKLKEKLHFKEKESLTPAKKNSEEEQDEQEESDEEEKAKAKGKDETDDDDHDDSETDDIPSKAAKKKTSSLLSEKEVKQKMKKILVTKHVDDRDGRAIAMYGFPDKKQAEKKEGIWQRGVVSTFFRVGRPLKPGKASSKIHGCLLKKIKGKTLADKEPIQLEGMCKRSFLIALSKVLSDKGHVPNLTFSLGKTTIKLETSSSERRKRQKGNCKMVIPERKFDLPYGAGSFKKISMMLQKKGTLDNFITNRTKIIASKFNSINFISFTEKDFTDWGKIKLFDYEASINPYTPEKQVNFVLDNMHFLNGLMFLITIVEVIVRLYRDKDGKVFEYEDENAIESDNLPVAIAQARSLILLSAGKISFKDFIGESDKYKSDADKHRAKFGLVTGKETIYNLHIIRDKLLDINETYNSTIREREAWKNLKEKYLQSNPKRHLIEGRSRMYFDLVDCYGSGNESDSDDPDYSSSDNELAVTKFKP